MNVTILLRILPDLGSKYSLLVDGERFGDMETLNDAIVVRDRLEDDDLTIAEAHVVLGARDKQERPVGLRELTAQRRMKLQPSKKT